MTTRESHRHLPPQGLPKPLALERIDEQFKGQWVLVQVTARNEYHTPVEGQVLASGTKKRVHKFLSTMAALERPSGIVYYLFVAGAFIRPGTEAMRQLIEQSAPHGHSGAAEQR